MDQTQIDRIQAKVAARMAVESGETAANPLIVVEEVDKVANAVASGTIRKVSYSDDETGEAYEMDVNDSDVDTTLRDMLVKTKRFESRESEVQSMKDEYSSRKEALNKREKELEGLLKAAGNAEVSEILEIARSKGSLDEYKKKIIDDHAKYMSMDERERGEYDAKRERADSLKREKSLQDKLEDLTKKQDVREQSLRKQERLVMYKDAFKGASFANTEANPALDRLNKTIFNHAAETLAKMEKEGVTLTDAIVQREFKKEYNLLSKTVTISKTNSVRDSINALDTAASIALEKGTKQTPRTAETKPETLTRWRGLLDTGKGKDILKEIQASPTMMDLYVAEGKNLANRNFGGTGRKR